MRKQSLFFKLFLSAMVFFTPMGANAQVTIGSSNPPSEWSLLDLNENADGTSSRALHLPRLDDTARDALVSPASLQSDRDLAEGLMIFNTETFCLEFWNGEEWISLCDGDTPIRRCRVRVPYSVRSSGWLTFMCHNLGAHESVHTMTPVQQTEASPNLTHGYLFQWGRTDDGHQVRNLLNLYPTVGAVSDLNTVGQPVAASGQFINVSASPNDWRTPQLDDLWTRNNGVNDPCPPGWHVPTEAEIRSFFNLTSSVGINDTERRFGNNYIRWVPPTAGGTSGIMVRPYDMDAPTLFLPAAGLRAHAGNVFGQENVIGYYWTATVSGTNARYMVFGNASLGVGSRVRAWGFSVRCVATE